MALQKEVQTKEGFTANYWRITAIHLTAKNAADTITILLYKDKARLDEGKSAILAKSYTFPFVENGETKNEIIHTSPFTSISSDPFVIAENWIKSLAEFSDCVDC